jgi:hypothetical protein
VVSTPIFGGFYKAWSFNQAYQLCTNLYPSVVDTHTGKEVGALYSTPGLDLLANVGVGAARGFKVFQGLLYVVSGNSVYSVNLQFAVTLVGTIGTAHGPVSMVSNGKQMLIIDGTNAYLVPGGQPLTGGTISDGGADYTVGDSINLTANDGQQNATAQILVSSVSGGAVTGFSVTFTGAFGPLPTTFSQASTTGSGTGFSLNLPTFGTFAPIYTVPLPFTGPAYGSYQDGLGLIAQGQSQIMWQTNLFDFSIIDPLAFDSADAEPDNIQALAQLHEEQFVFKSTNTEVWINAGISGFAFQRLAGVHIELGCAAPFSVALCGESLIWLAMNEQGEGTVHQITGYEPKKISTKAIDSQIQSYAIISDAVAYSYQQSGRLFYVLRFPTGNATWVYDLTTGLWHQRAAFANGAFSQHWSNCYASFSGKNVVGDYRNGNIYAIDQNALTDNGTPKKWVRTWRALKEPVYVPMTFAALEIDLQTGINIPAGTAPLAVLRWSDDGCHTWSDERFQAVGPVGATAQRVIFRRLGSTRFNSGLDRVFELSGTDQYPVAIINADLT